MQLQTVSEVQPGDLLDREGLVFEVVSVTTEESTTTLVVRPTYETRGPSERTMRFPSTRTVTLR